MSRNQYEMECDKVLSRLADVSSNGNDDDIVIALCNAIEKLGADYASIR